MRVLFDVNHPAQVHLFRPAVSALQREGHDTLVTSREKEMTTDLLDAYGIDHRPLTTAADGPVGTAVELARRELALLRAARRFDPDVIVSRLVPPAVHVATVLGCRTVVFKDTVLPSRLMRFVYHGVTLPCVDDICTPPGFDLPVDDDYHHVVGFQELAYLHPNRFEPDPGPLLDRGIDPDDPFFVLRFSGWDAYHDVGNAGLSRAGKRDLVSSLAERGDVFITSEADLPQAFEPYRLSVPPEHVHHLLAYADLYVGDSQTMPTEAALLGTPAIRVNSLVGEHDMHNFVELEEEYGLLFSFADASAAVEKAKSIAAAPDDGRWAARRERFLADHRDVTAFMLSLVRGDPPESGGGKADGSEDRRSTADRASEGPDRGVTDRAG